MKTALIIGGSRGIGRAIAVRLAQSGFTIWLTYKSNHDAANLVKKEIEALGVDCELMAFDVANYQQVQEALEKKCMDNVPEVLVYNAGITRDNLMIWMSKEEWDTVIDTNLNGFYNVTRQLIFPMLQRKKGHIIAIASVSGQIGQAGQINYAASKAGLIGAVKSLAREIGKKNIFVNAVSPGIIDTEMTEELDFNKIKHLVPLQCMGKASDVAETVEFLCSERQTYIHGQVIGVNGGLAI
ncbi:MAG: 3-oxoacyl-ACP reductase FabG [Sedimentisphaerales bacterium]|nr:3-oxoacyl-ACP reductase FabG [Sedimentisphaerales bacterium]